MKVLIAFGTRPEAIKLAPIIQSLLSDQRFEVRICATGQHRQMVDQVLRLFRIQAHFDLDVMEYRQDLNDLTVKIISGMKNVYRQWKPDWVLVHGDTTTTLAVCLSASYAGIKIGHVEAGLRTKNKNFPWPEEVNRRVAAVLADLHFAPTITARSNLLQEGIDPKLIHVTGNTVVDSLNSIIERLREETKLFRQCESHFSFLEANRNLILVTCHRRENAGQGVENLCGAVQDLVNQANVQVIFPVHPNPEVKAHIQSLLGNLSGVYLVEPLNYLHFVYLLDRCAMVITDSGGVQEEAASLGKPILVTRHVTERPEGVSAGLAHLVGTDREQIIRTALNVLQECHLTSSRLEVSEIYGNGTSSFQIHQILLATCLKPSLLSV